MSFNILLAEDDEDIVKLLKLYLENEGFVTFRAKDGVDACEIFDKEKIDLALVDIMMPRMNGYELTKYIRQKSNIPIIILSAAQLDSDKILGLNLGADDYMVKPIDEQEMILRIAALLRRSRIASERRLEIGMLVLDYDTFTVTHPRIQTELPKKEFLLLFKLLSFPGKIFTKRQLMDDIWNYDSESDEHTIEVHIGRLRERFREVPEFEIVTVRGLGYKAVRKDGESAR